MLPAAVGDRLGKFMDHADAVAADRGNHDMLFHRRKFYRMGACQGESRHLR